MSNRNILTTFPEELISEIISHLSLSRPAIKACRLTCYVLHRMSSLHLFPPSAILAKRPEVLNRSIHIVEHPLFRDCVEEFALVDTLAERR